MKMHLSPIIHTFHIGDVDKSCGQKNENWQFAQEKIFVEKKSRKWKKLSQSYPHEKTGKTEEK